MEPTTPSNEGGVATATVPQENIEAVSLGEAGAPVLRPKVAPLSTPQSQQQLDEPTAPAAPNPDEPQAPSQPAEPEQPTQSAEDDLTDWATKQNIDLDNPTPEQARQLAKRLRDTQQKMHEATEQARQLESSMTSSADLPYTGDPNYDQLALQVNSITIQNRVADFFRSNPDARDYEQKMAEIVTERPHLKNDLDALYALAVNSPSRTAELKKEGGREALTNLAQKQSAVPPTASASTGASSSQEKITPDNVDSVVAAHMGDAKWYSAHKSEVDRAMAGTR